MSYDYTADFETTTDENDCRVWAFAIATIDDDPAIVYGNSIDDFFSYIQSLKNPKIYFHNLKFDGEFIISYLLTHGYEWVKESKEAIGGSFTTMITGNGLFYQITVYFNKKGHKTEKATFLDSLKLLNFSVDKIATDFHLPIQKLSIDYKAKREVGHELTKEEVDYISNDVGIMARALNIMFERGLTKMTIGSNALADYKDTQEQFRRLFPTMKNEYDADIRKAYRGGWTYLNPNYREKMIGNGCVIDKNSMYPSQMYYQKLPVGLPVYFDGKYEDDPLHPLYVQSFSCSFELKPNRLPSIQIKSGFIFKINEWLTSSHGEYVQLSLTSVDLKLFLENYEVYDIVYHGGWKFNCSSGLFSEYIDKWTTTKIESKKAGNSALYLISKLMLNSLYGKFGTNPISILKRPIMKDGVIHYQMLPKEEKKPVYIPMASFITAYARYDIISNAQKIVDYSIAKYGENRFIYADTDSLHVELSANEIREIPGFDLDPYRLGAWDLETEFDRAKFLRQKCYMEEVDSELSVHIAGLPRELAKFMTFDCFRPGFKISDLGKEVISGKEKLNYKHVKGGVVLTEVDFTIKGE